LHSISLAALPLAISRAPPAVSCFLSYPSRAMLAEARPSSPQAAGLAPDGACDCRVPLCLHSMVSDGAAAADGAPIQRKAFEPYHSKSVPRSEDLKAGDRLGPSGKGPITTMMLRNIPNKYSQSTLMEEIDEMGFAGTYDFFYLPMDVQNRSNVGYAFVNFRAPSYAQRFFGMFSEHRFRKHPSRKVSNVSAAHLQGLDANLKHFENRAVTHARNDQYRPVVLNGTRRIDFDEAVARATGLPNPKAPAAAGPVKPGDCDDALLRHVLSSARQVSDASNSTSASTAPMPSLPPPPGLEVVQASMGWNRQTSAPEPSRAPPSPPPEVLTLSALQSQPLRRPVRPRALSEGREPSRAAEDDPAYVPLPTIPSASKIFSACHAGLFDDLQDLFPGDDAFTGDGQRHIEL